MKIYDINTWKHLMFTSSMEVATIQGIDNMATGCSLTKEGLHLEEEKFAEGQRRYGYKEPERHAHKPNWWEYMDLRFNVIKPNGDTASWRVKKVIPLTEERFKKHSNG